MKIQGSVGTVKSSLNVPVSLIVDKVIDERGEDFNLHIELLGYKNEDIERIFFKNIEICRLPENLGIIFPNLRTLSVVECKVKSLHRSDFKGMKKLEEFYFIGNHVLYLPNNLFKETPELQYISFYGNKTEVVGPKLFNKLNSLKYVNLKCNYNYDICFSESKGMSLEDFKMSLLEKYYENYNIAFKLEERNSARKKRIIANPNLIIHKEIGDRLSGWNFSIERIFLKDLDITELPKNLGKYFPNLRTLSVVECDIEKLHKPDFNLMQKLEEFYFIRNQLIFLPNDLFEEAPELQYISFYGNKIEVIGLKVFDALQNLKYIDLQCNKNYDICYDESKGSSFKTFKSAIEEAYNSVKYSILLDESILSYKIDSELELQKMKQLTYTKTVHNNVEKILTSKTLRNFNYNKTM